MALSESKSRSNQKYRDKFDYIVTRVTPEEKETLMKHAEAVGESLNSFMRRAAAETITKDLQKK